jgi:7-cyano-7-deazaguanine synthase
MTSLGEVPDRVVIMLSGGIDSTTVAYHLRKQVNVPHLRGIALNYGQEDYKRARQSLNRLSVDLDLPIEYVDIHNLVNAFAGFIEQDYEGFPMMLTELSRKSAAGSMVSAVYAESIGFHALAEGVNKDDLERYVFRRDVHRHIAEVQSLGNDFKFQVVTPLIDMTKVECLRLAVALDVPFEATWSCWRGNIRHCGRCPGCDSRVNAFQEAGLTDPVVYEPDPA